MIADTLPADPDLNEARALVDARRYRAALRLLRGAGPGGLERLRLRGLAHLGHRDAPAAIDCLRRVLADQPDDPGTIEALARAHQADNAPFPAVRWFERAACLTPGGTALAAALSGAYRRDARYRDALMLARAALSDGLPGADLRYEAAMAAAYLGDDDEALAHFDALLADDPEHAAAWFGSHAQALHRHGPDEALRRLRRATRCGGANGKYWGYLAATLRLLGRDGEADAVEAAEIGDNPKRRPLPDGARALLPHLAADFRLFGNSARLLRHALACAGLPGLVLEFGVRRGTSLDHIAEAAGQDVHGFDSFEGLPEGWVNSPRGVLTTGRQLPRVRGNARLHVGWFEDSLPPFLADTPGPLRFANVDSDIYASARTVLGALADRVRPGSVIVFDEYIGNRSWRDDEYRAFQEFAAETGLRYEYFAASPYTKQVAVRVLEVAGARS
ncbi:class I SAM-dependent methyltransferase [Azospirillum picis]|uniref:Tetratricopeptide (TPR) repeat protein n=1 Tax=Azospirillum picis TaxID=488438 RepID=A0ABU0MTQ3_9PROT|nr:class I SAM-dependent methyltransferase [Azospirillum picis]MBP2302901.1 tetratricopeptide (TPR) repeat protein [Azospirillum picis]MDQ0536594.1 tetratricopeptide (TPR) repeat protein [Azospirillum picis]